MSERTFVRVVHWVGQVDELGLGDPGINNLDLRDGRIARVNGASVERWAWKILCNSGVDEIAFEAILGDGRRVRICGSLLPQQFQVRFEQGGKESCFVALASVSRLLARSAHA